jgi:hypothetical protein
MRCARLVQGHLLANHLTEQYRMIYLPRLLYAPLVAALFATSAASAGSIVGDSFDLGVSYDDGAGGTATAGPFSGTASGAPGAVFSGAEADIAGNFMVGGSQINAHALWIDEDTVHLFFQGDATDFNNLVLTLSGLDFKTAGQPAAIVGASFNRNGGGGGAFSGFNEVILGIVQDPAIGFAANSVTMSFGFFSANLTADGPVMEINIQTAVPEPATYALVLSGLAALGFARRRASKAHSL